MQDLVEALDYIPDLDRTGVYALSFDTYSKLDAMSASGLNLFKRSPRHYLCRRYGELQQKDAPALRFGRAQHCLLLQPELFDVNYEICAEGKKRTKDSLKEQLTFKEGEVLYAMRDAFRAHPYAKHFIETAARELSIVWRWQSQTEELSVRCKGRLDAVVNINGVLSIVDLKTTSDARPQAFERAIYRYGYHRQGAFYVDGARAAGINAKHYVIIAIEKEPPFGLRLYRLMDEALQIGRRENEEALLQVAKCLKNGDWPCYDPEVVDIGIPTWAISMEGFEDEH